MIYKTLIKILVCFLIISCASKKVTLDSFKNQNKLSEIPENLYPSDTIRIQNHGEWTKTHYPKRIKQFKENPLIKGDIVMIGNSITEGGKSWGKRFQNNKVRNRGISGDTSDGVLQRLDEIIWAQPKSIFLLIGTNDLWSTNSPEKTVSNILTIINKIEEKSTKTKIYLQTVFPVSNNSKTIKDKILAINKLLKANRTVNNYEFIDTYKLLVDADGNLTKEYTSDGVHLTEKGYEVWTNLLIKYINK